MLHRPPPQRTLGGLAGRAVLRAAVPVVAIGLAAGLLGQPDPGPPREATDVLPTPVQRAVDRHHCSTTGFADRAPESALVVTERGRLRLVSYERGWQIFTGHRSGRLVAVCLDRV